MYTFFSNFVYLSATIYNLRISVFQLCVILEPMQELMSRHKAYALSPRDCLKTTLFQKWQKMVAPPGKEKFFEAFCTMRMSCIETCRIVGDIIVLGLCMQSVEIS